jgi:peroxiredoxin (alkyl hydroperoxide reductase subunit C)
LQTTAGIEVGVTAPDFRLKGPGGQYVTLSEYAGKKNVVLVFYPLAFSGVCSHQLPALQRRLPELDALDAVVLGISVDSHFANTAFAERLGVSFPLLSDFKRRTSEAYGVLIHEAGFAWRSMFVVNKAGKIAYKDVSPDPDDLERIPSVQRVIEALRAQD